MRSNTIALANFIVLALLTPGNARSVGTYSLRWHLAPALVSPELSA